MLEYGSAAYLADKPSPEPGAGPIADLRAGWDLHVGFGLANPALFRLMYTDSRPGQLPAGMEILRTRIRNIAAAGRFKVGEELAVGMVHAAGCGAVLALLAVPEQSRDPQLSDARF